MIENIYSSKAPQAIGPYSQAVKANGLIFVSGQLPLDPLTGILISGDISYLTKLILTHIEAILLEAQSSLKKVVKTEVFLINLNDFTSMNEEYEKFFIYKPYPARQTIEVSKLPKGSPIEISCIALA